MASLLSLALHGKLEYLTDILRTLLGDLAAHYVHRNPKLMLRRLAWALDRARQPRSWLLPSRPVPGQAGPGSPRRLVGGGRPDLEPPPCRTETMVEKLLTNWVSICLYAFLRVRAPSPRARFQGCSLWPH